MARYMQIIGGVASNAVEVLDPSMFPEWELVRSDSAEIGDIWVEDVFEKPEQAPLPVPQVVTMRQARLALLAAGLLPGVAAAIASLPKSPIHHFKSKWPMAAKCILTKFKNRQS